MAAQRRRDQQACHLEVNVEDEPGVPGPFSCVPIEVGHFGASFADFNTFASWPLLGPLLFENETSDARDHCANERTFLASLRLSVYMSVVAVAIAVSFHLRSPPTAVEQRLAKPLGIIFWFLSLASLVVGLGNYIRTVNMYSRRVAIVQSGWRTQCIMSFIALFIFGTCVALLVVDQIQADD
ncbi:putative duf202 domain-containing protein [Rosellinia necatrix]|uniref:Putative duf202 domain-containing protein n=1 Tax=Rosellinia necatrix TaxID=77044 RepID=A0A1W2TEB5_ROSNE|nr:putative duf202 domain-containing protein [Rosellinia necatrix]